MENLRREHFVLQYISYPNTLGDHLPGIQAVLKGGVKWIQLRMKNQSLEEIERVALKVKTLCESYKATFILNDYPELVARLDLDGVHLGKTDLSAEEARILIGDDKIIGRTCHTLDDLKEASQLPIDYIGFGPYKYTQTKENIDQVLGHDVFKKIEHWNSSYQLKPIVGIGGIEQPDISDLISYGIKGIAASGMFRKKTTEEINNIVEDINHGFIKNRR